MRFSILRNSTRLAIITLGTLLTTTGQPARLAAQCNGDLRNEITGLLAISDSMIANLRRNDGGIPRDSASAIIGNAEIFGGKASRAGPSAGCLIERQTVFAQTALSLLPPGETVSSDTVRYAIAQAGAALLGERYHASDRIGLVFGIGINRVFDKQDTETFKIVSRRDSVGTDERYVVEESDSRQFPSAVTGLLVRFRERPDLTSRNWEQALVPTAAFASVQFSNLGATGPVNGASLGLGWQLTGSTHVLFGYSIYRVKALREDLRAEWGERSDGRLRLPDGETEESILGVEGANAFTFSLAIPVSLRAAFGAP
jgi:hypothetical protein